LTSFNRLPEKNGEAAEPNADKELGIKSAGWNPAVVGKTTLNTSDYG